MDSPTQLHLHNTATAIAVGASASLGALVVAGTAWTTLGYVLAWKLHLSIGMILPPFASGCLGGLVMRIGRAGLRGKTGWIAAAVTLTGCIIGDFVWIMLAQQKPLSTLLGDEMTQTFNTLFNLQKTVMYVIACYLAYVISNPPRAFVSD